MATKVLDGKYKVEVSGKFIVAGNKYNTDTLTPEQAEHLLSIGWDGIKAVKTKELAAENPSKKHIPAKE